MEHPRVMNDEIRALIETGSTKTATGALPGCGYCMPCPVGIEINNCALDVPPLRRSPSEGHLSPRARR